MARQLSIAVVYPADIRLKSIRRVMEDVFGAEVNISDHSHIGVAHTRTIGVQVPDALAFHAARRRIGAAMPAVGIKMMERFRESWWARHRRAVAIAIGAGPLRPLAARMREASG